MYVDEGAFYHDLIGTENQLARFIDGRHLNASSPSFLRWRVCTRSSFANVRVSTEKGRKGEGEESRYAINGHAEARLDYGIQLIKSETPAGVVRVSRCLRRRSFFFPRCLRLGRSSAAKN